MPKLHTITCATYIFQNISEFLDNIKVNIMPQWDFQAMTRLGVVDKIK